MACTLNCPERCSVVLAFLTRHNRAPSGVLELSLAALGFVSSIATISLISKEVVSLLTSLALMLGFSTSILSLTLLATGNSVCSEQQVLMFARRPRNRWPPQVGDAMANITLGRKGKFSMAVAAIFAGPIFHDLAGTAVAFAGACIQHHGVLTEAAHVNNLPYAVNHANRPAHYCVTQPWAGDGWFLSRSKARRDWCSFFSSHPSYHQFWCSAFRGSGPAAGTVSTC